MVFFFNLLIAVLYCSCVDRQYNRQIYSSKLNKSILDYCPLILFWIFLCGSQYKVGTDYESYIKIFNGYNNDFYSQNGEILFSNFIKLCNLVGIKGQALYYIIYTISFYFLFLIIKRTKIRYSAIFILMYIAISSVFNNQFNIVRQCLAIYIGSYSAILAIEGQKNESLLLTISATLIHTSAITFIVFLIPSKILSCLNKIKMEILLFVGLFLSFILSVSMLDHFIPYLPSTYGWYIKSGDLGESNILTSLTKYIFFPFYLLAIIKYPKLELEELDNKLFKWGVIGFTIRICLLNLPLVNRLSASFLIISLFPLYYYFESLIKSRSLNIIIFLFFIILFYAIKVLLFPKAEYIYQSIFFQ